MKDKSLEERNCYMQFKWNNTLDAWGGYLTKDEDPKVKEYVNGISGSIKCFIYNTQEECTAAATAWANRNPRSLHNFKEPQ